MRDILRGIDFGLLDWLTTMTGTSTWLSLAVYTVAELFIVIPFIVLAVLWRKKEPVSNKHGNQKAALMAILVLVFALALKSLIVFLWFRARPFVSHPELMTLPLKVDPSSFPSGHTIIAFSLAFSLLHSGLKKAGSWLLFIAILIGLARVMAGVHYPSDVIGGILVSLGASWYLHREVSSIRRFLPDH